MMKKTIILGSDKRLDKLPGNLVIGKVLSMIILKQYPDLLLTVVIENRTLPAKDCFDIFLTDLGTWMEDNQVIQSTPRGCGQQDNDKQKKKKKIFYKTYHKKGLGENPARNSGTITVLARCLSRTVLFR